MDTNFKTKPQELTDFHQIKDKEKYLCFSCDRYSLRLDLESVSDVILWFKKDKT